MATRTFTAILHKEDRLWVAECPEVGAFSQGSDVEDALANLKEATELYIEEFPMEKTVPERIADFLRQNKPHAYCDDCLQTLLELAQRQQSQQATKPLGASGAFVREHGRCFHHGGEAKLVIRAK
jgi:predicted RNase H-like HicB family nuclease